jgi:hypothetical protein
MAPLLELPTELRHKILARAIWTPELPPDCPAKSEDRVRLREDWGVWVPVMQVQPHALLLVLTCRTFRDDIAYILASQPAIYELDIMFIPRCGLWPTWTYCPTPRLVRISAIHASFRTFEANGDLSQRFGGNCSFHTTSTYPNPPPGAWNFYRLLASLLALGPRALSSPILQSTNHGSLSTCRYTVERLILRITSKQKTELDELRSLERMFSTIPEWDSLHENPTVPYGAGEIMMFRGPGEESPYSWSGRTHFGDIDVVNSGDSLGFYIANTLWALLDFKWLSRGFGLIAYEGILDTIEIWVDGKSRLRYDMDDLLSRLPETNCSPEDMDALVRWREWVTKWRTKSREGVLFTEPRPSLPFGRYQPHRPDEWRFPEGFFASLAVATS